MAEIERFGVISFARFMELALFCPVYGYYEKEGDRIGRRGDYYTSASVGDLFGELLAFQFAEWLRDLAGGDLRILEGGAHDGGLAAAILGWFRGQEPDLFAKLQYWILEPSDIRWSWQKTSLKEFEGKIFRSAGFEAFKENGVRGVIFSNELLDSMPVHRLGWDACGGKWFEWGVGLDGDRFVWRRVGLRDEWRSEVEGAAPSPPLAGERERPGQSQLEGCNEDSEAGGLSLLDAVMQVPKAFLDCLPDGFTIETCPAAERWWRGAASSLREGKLLTLDYGLESAAFLAPERPHGTLRAYSNHRVSDDVLKNPGEQDITAHVNFGVLRKAGEKTGLLTEALISQEQFLLGIVRRMSDVGVCFPPWAGRRAAQLQTLTHPEHLGGPFSVLIQSRCRS